MQCKHTEWWRSCRTWELESGWKKRKESLKKPWSLSSASFKLNQSKEQSNNIHHVRLDNELETYVNNLKVGTNLLAWPLSFWHVQADELNWTELGVTFCFLRCWVVLSLCIIYVNLSEKEENKRIDEEWQNRTHANSERLKRNNNNTKEESSIIIQSFEVGAKTLREAKQTHWRTLIFFVWIWLLYPCIQPFSTALLFTSTS